MFATHYEIPSAWKDQLDELRKEFPIKWYFKLLPNIIFFAALAFGLFMLFAIFVMVPLERKWTRAENKATEEQKAEENVNLIDTTLAELQKNLENVTEEQLRISIVNKIRDPHTTDFYHLKIESYSHGNKDRFFKVQRSTDDKIFLVTPRENPFEGYQDPVLDTLKLLHFSENGIYRQGYWFSKVDLEKGLKETSSQKYQYWPDNPRIAKYLLTEIIRIPQMADTLKLPEKSRLK